MNDILADSGEFSALIQRFFAQRLMQQRNVSPRTLTSYRDTFRMLLQFAQTVRGKRPAELTLKDFDATLILDFLRHLEDHRHNSVRSRNLRLAAIRSFVHYVSLQCPPALHVANQILAIPMKRFDKPMIGFLSRKEINALMATPNLNTWFGQRDRILLGLLYNTGARVSELTGICVQDLTLDVSPCVRLHGKGRKQRTVPLWKETATELRRWLRSSALKPDQPVVPNRHGQRMTRVNVAERIALTVAAASERCPELKRHKVSPHVFRHTTAMHLLQAGVDITVIELPAV
jgi:integrase/recombinase XerD